MSFRGAQGLREPQSQALTPSRPAPPVPGRDSPSFAPQQVAFGSSPFAVPGAGAGSAQTIVRRGWVGVKEDGLRAWIWSKRWLVLREQTLNFYKNEVRRWRGETATDTARQAPRLLPLLFSSVSSPR